MADPNVEIVDRTTVRVSAPSIPVEMLKRILSSEPDDALVSVTPVIGGDQRDPYPVGMTIVINRGGSRG